MAHYIFIQGVRPDSWELLEKVERDDLAEEVFRNYQMRLSGRKHEVIEMVEAPNALEGQARLRQEPPEKLLRCTPYASAPKPWQHRSSSC